VLHLKSGCSLLDEEVVLTTERLDRSGIFDGFERILVPDGEAAAANALRINDVALVGAGYTATIALLRARGFVVIPLRTEEIARIDAGLSCMSLRWHE
jgi:dimethylargininase